MRWKMACCVLFSSHYWARFCPTCCSCLVVHFSVVELFILIRNKCLIRWVTWNAWLGALTELRNCICNYLCIHQMINSFPTSELLRVHNLIGGVPGLMAGNCFGEFGITHDGSNGPSVPSSSPLYTHRVACWKVWISSFKV